MNKTVYSVKECAALLGVSMPIMYQLCARLDFPAVRVSDRRIVIPVAALEQWLNEKATGRGA